MSMRPVITRFAPSPTGFQHIGGMRTALFAHLWARKHGGTFILRIEDTDQERAVPGAIEHVQESLAWLRLDWDYGPDKPGAFGSCIQSERLETYRKAAQTLIDKGLAYPDPYSFEEINALRAQAKEEKRPFLFREHRPAHFGEWDGSRPLRFKVPEIKRYSWNDEVRGELSAGEEALDDFVLIKSDGYPTYNLAHIVDDHAMGVTYIFRADEFISSTPRFLSLYEALEIDHPAFVTLPPILREDRTKKLGKRDGAKDILTYRDDGYLADAMVNFLALTGWNPGTEQEIFDRDDLLRQFDVKRIQTHGAVIGEEKLDWINRSYLNTLSSEAFNGYAAPALIETLQERGLNASEDVVVRAMPIVRERVSSLTDVRTLVGEGELDFFFASPQLDPAMLPGKGNDTDTARIHLTRCLEMFSNVDERGFSDTETLKTNVWEYATEHGRGAVLWPLRYALTGRERSPDPFAVAATLGKTETLIRIRHALNLLDS